MKKSILLVLMLALALTFAACKTTETTEPIEQQPTAVAQQEPVAVVQPAQPEPVAEQPVVEEPAAVEPATEPVAEVIATAVAMSVEEVNQKFSYIYGHLLATNIVSEGIRINPSYFALGSEDFINYADLRIDMDAINQAFNDYQGYLEGTLTEETLLASPSTDPAVPSSLLEKFSYGYGYLIMYNLQTDGINVLLDEYTAGIADAIAGVPLSYTAEQIDEIFMAYQNNMMEAYYSAMESMAADSLAQAEAFLADNATQDGVVTTASGLQYKVITEGTGAKPTAADTVKVDYLITFLDGTTGDNSYQRGEPSVFQVANLIPGFVEGVLLMTEGSHYQFFVHPDLAYGPLGNDAIPANTLLIFDVELHEIVKPQ